MVSKDRVDTFYYTFLKKLSKFFMHFNTFFSVFIINYSFATLEGVKIDCCFTDLRKKNEVFLLHNFYSVLRVFCQQGYLHIHNWRLYSFPTSVTKHLDNDGNTKGIWVYWSIVAYLLVKSSQINNISLWIVLKSLKIVISILVIIDERSWIHLLFSHHDAQRKVPYEW